MDSNGFYGAAIWILYCLIGCCMSGTKYIKNVCGVTETFNNIRNAILAAP